MMDRHDWDELDQIRLTEESKQALIGALTAQQSNPQKKVCNPHHWRKTALVAAAVAAALVVSVGAAVVAPAVMRDYFGNSAGYQQSAVELGQSITQNGWTMTLTDCAADDYTIYLGVTLTAPEGTVLDQVDGYYFADWSHPDFPTLEYGGGGGYELLEDGNPTDNQLSFVFTGHYFTQGDSLDGKTMELQLGKLYHHTVWKEAEMEWGRAYDCNETWNFSTTINLSDHIIRLKPNLPVHTLDVDAVITDVVVSPLTVFVNIEGDALKGHHSWVPKNAPDGWYGCIDYQEIILYTKDGTAIPMMEGLAGSGCSGGTDSTEDGWIQLMRRPDIPLDVENLASISICGVEIPLT